MEQKRRAETHTASQTPGSLTEMVSGEGGQGTAMVLPRCLPPHPTQLPLKGDELGPENTIETV